MEEQCESAGRRGSCTSEFDGMSEENPPGDQAAAAQGFPQPPPEPQSPLEQQPATPGRSVVVRYGVMRNLGLSSHDLEAPLPPGARVVVRTDRGVELGQVVANVESQGGFGAIIPEALEEFIRCNGPDYPFTRDGRVLRPANSQDLIDYRHLENSAREEAGYCRQEIRELNLPMKLVTVEHLLGGERIVFYFSAESRVDFRELVRRLAWQYRTRIEMRQVGARDEARLVGDLERCGRPCCCQRFLKDLKPVSMRMAKTQKATLDPSKISGRCGRLMCCLRYEDQGYEELRKKLPRKNTYVRTASATGRVVDMQILTQLVRLGLSDNTQVVVANEEIVERDLPAPPGPLQPGAPAAEMEEDLGPSLPGVVALPEAQEQDLVAPEKASLPEAFEEAPLEEAPASEAPDVQQPQPASASQGESIARRRRRPRHKRRHRRGRGGRAPGAGPRNPTDANPRPQAPQANSSPDGRPQGR